MMADLDLSAPILDITFEQSATLTLLRTYERRCFCDSSYDHALAVLVGRGRVRPVVKCRSCSGWCELPTTWDVSVYAFLSQIVNEHDLHNYYQKYIASEHLMFVFNFH